MECLVSVVCGFAYSIYQTHMTNFWGNAVWPTHEIKGRGLYFCTCSVSMREMRPG